jgi:hypothetical protein
VKAKQRLFAALYGDGDVPQWCRDIADAIEAEAVAENDGRCEDRCGGIIGHDGPHQPGDYVPPSEARAAALRGVVDELGDLAIGWQASGRAGDASAIRAALAALSLLDAEPAEGAT